MLYVQGPISALPAIQDAMNVEGLSFSANLLTGTSTQWAFLLQLPIPCAASGLFGAATAWGCRAVVNLHASYL